MAGGTHAKGPMGYLETEYFQPWPGLDLSAPSSRIQPGAAISANGMDIRGGLTLQPAFTQPIGSNYPIVLPTSFGPPFTPTFPPFGQEWTAGLDETILLIANLAGVTY